LCWARAAFFGIGSFHAISFDFDDLRQSGLLRRDGRGHCRRA